MSTTLPGAATVRRRLCAQCKRGPDLVEHLRLIARQHQACYEIWPTWSSLCRKRTHKSFNLLLCGVNGHEIHEGNDCHAVPCCTHCAHTYSELREIAEWILDLKKPRSGFEIYSFDRALHMAPHIVAIAARSSSPPRFSIVLTTNQEITSAKASA